jgi:hypothetical protein
MSHKNAKWARKQVKNYINQNMQPEQPQFSFKQLQTFIELHIHLTGKKPETIELNEVCYNWYVQESHNQAELMGLQPSGFKGDKPTFLGVTLEKKVNIVIPEKKVITPEEIKAN